MGQVAANGRFKRIVNTSQRTCVYTHVIAPGARWPTRGDAPQTATLARGMRSRESAALG